MLCCSLAGHISISKVSQGPGLTESEPSVTDFFRGSVGFMAPEAFRAIVTFVERNVAQVCFLNVCFLENGDAQSEGIYFKLLCLTWAWAKHSDPQSGRLND
jgi:hypothetical protein